MYKALAWGKPAPYELIIWDVAERFGWTPEYIESMPYKRLQELSTIDEARGRARQSLKNKKK